MDTSSGQPQCTSTSGRPRAVNRSTATGRRQNDSSTAAGASAARANRTSVLAAPNRRDQSRSPTPRASKRASLTVSFASSGTASAAASGRASVVLPAPGRPETTTTVRSSLRARGVVVDDEHPAEPVPRGGRRVAVDHHHVEGLFVLVPLVADDRHVEPPGEGP